VSIASRAKDRFVYYLAMGLTMMISLQALVNFAVATGLVPTKGLPLPFVSYGGSSLLVNMAAIGLLLRISKGEEGEVASNNQTVIMRQRARRKIETLKRKAGIPDSRVHFPG